MSLTLKNRTRLKVSHRREEVVAQIRPKSAEQVKAYIAYLEQTVQQRESERNLALRELNLKAEKERQMIERTHTLMTYIRAFDLDFEQKELCM